MLVKYRLPLEILHLVNLLLCGLFSRLYSNLARQYRYVMHLVDVYGPFAFFKGWYVLPTYFSTFIHVYTNTCTLLLTSNHYCMLGLYMKLRRHKLGEAEAEDGEEQEPSRRWNVQLRPKDHRLGGLLLQDPYTRCAQVHPQVKHTWMMMDYIIMYNSWMKKT